MEKADQKTLFYTRLTAILLAVVLIVLCVAAALLVPRAVNALDRADRAISAFETLTESAAVTLANADDTFAALASAADETSRLVEGNADAVSEVVEKVNAVDFESLGQAISDLEDVVGSLSRAMSLIVSW